MDFPPLINGKNWDWGDILFVLFGTPVVGITEINYGRTRGSENNYGAGHEPVGYGNKNFEYKGDITVYMEEIEALLAKAPNRSILEIPPFTINVSFGGLGVATTIHKLKNVRFTEDVFAGKQNDSMLLMKIPFTYAGLIK